MKGNSKDLFSTHSKDKLGKNDLPQGFDQRFLNKLEQVKKKSAPRPMQKELTLWDELLSLIAPLGMAIAVVTFIIMSVTNIPTSRHLQTRTELLTKIQTQEIAALSTLPEGEWDYLIGSAD